MAVAKKLSVPAPIKKYLEATDYCISAMQQMDDAAWKLSMIVFRFKDVLSKEQLAEISRIQENLKKEIHQTNVATNGLFVKLEDAVRVHAAGPQIQSILVPKNLVVRKTDQKILIGLPEGCKNQGYGAWFSRKFVTESPDGDSLQVRYYSDWLISLYRYEPGASGRMEPVERKEADAMEFAADIRMACRLQHHPDMSYIQEG